jgi:radical SAM enzyme (TIGR01210 family)
MLGCQNKINSHLINRQVETAICHELLDSEKYDSKEIILSNNGSIFDAGTLPHASLLYFVSKTSHELPNLKKLVFETRIEHVNRSVLQQIKEALEFDDKNIQVELAVGVEIFDDEVRNKHYKKGLRLEQLEKFAEELGNLGIKLRCYMMYKPLVGMTRQQADEDITKAVNYFDRLVEKYNIDLTMHINPTFAAIDTDLAEAFEKGEYTPPALADLRQLLHSFKSSKINIYVGLNDEGLAVPGGSFIKPGCEKDLDKLKKFNFTGDFNYLK